MAKLVDDATLKIQNLSAIEIERIEPVDFMRLLRSIWYGKWILLWTSAIAIIAAGYYAFAIASPQFASTTTLKIDTKSGPILDVEQFAAGLTTDQSSLNTEVAILRSRHLLEMVVDDLDLIADPEFNRYLTPIPTWSLTGVRNHMRSILSGKPLLPPDQVAILDKTVDNLASALSVDTLRDTYIFRITATTSNAKMSARIADTLAEHYLADQVTAKQMATENAINWLSERVYALQLELEAKETAVNDIIVANQASKPEVLDALSRQSLEAEERLRDTQRALRNAETKLQSFDALPTNAALNNTPTRQQLLSDVQRYTHQEAALEVFQDGIDSQLANQSAGLVRLQQLRREADATRVLYETFLARLQETSIQRGLQNADSRILANASPGQYVAPRKMLILLIAAILGAAIGIAAILFRHGLRRGVTSADELADIADLPVLTQIPRFKLRKPMQMLDYLNAQPTSATAEAVRNLRTSLLLADPAKVPQVILSTSSIAGEGKTTQSIALAHNLVGLGKSVLLVEADMRQPAFGNYLQVDGGDLGEVVAGACEMVDAIGRDQRLAADVLPSHKINQNPADLFSGAAFAAFMAEIRSQYDFIILDAPPVLPVPDARLLAQHADAVLYTVRWETTDKRLVLAGKRALEAVRTPITGMVLAQIDLKRAQQYGGVHVSDYGQAYYQN